MAKKALVSPDEPVLYISAWTPDVSTENYTPTLTTIVNGARIAQVVEPDATFDIGEPMFWVDATMIIWLIVVIMTHRLIL